MNAAADAARDAEDVRVLMGLYAAAVSAGRVAHYCSFILVQFGPPAHSRPPIHASRVGLLTLVNVSTLAAATVRP